MTAVDTTKASMKRRESPWDNGFGLLSLLLPSGLLHAVFSAVTARRKPLIATNAELS